MKTIKVESPIGNIEIDSGGAAIGAVRLDPELSYPAIPALLKQVMDDNNESAWADIMTRINYTYDGVAQALDNLESESHFSETLCEQVKQGKRLLFKPNIVAGSNYDPITHEPAQTAVNTPWPFMAALMRWFHDRLDISYHQMCLAEGATMTSVVAGMFTRMQDDKREITTQAVIEGKSGDFYGGWGFYFIRRYLADSHPSDHTDDPMNGFVESEAGLALAPGQALDKLMVYDINKVEGLGVDGREVPVKNGINYESIVLHKVLVGGDPTDAEDMKNYPGCVLINVPKLKVHVLDLVTNAVKNLGIGLYPMEFNICEEPGKIEWKYGTPDKPMAGMKDKLPHIVWQVERDEKTKEPILDTNGEPVWKKTGGLMGTIADVMVAMMGQNVYMLHVTDAIEPANGLQAGPAAVGVPEGFVFASCDPLALDVLSTRYLFSNTPMAEAAKAQKEQNLQTDFLQKVPIPYLDSQHIKSKEGYDSPLWRYPAFPYYEERGIGQPAYYVLGKDVKDDKDLVSVRGHLGNAQDGQFNELKTQTFYFAVAKPLWDLQATTLAFLKANDQLDGTDWFSEVMDAFDDNKDGVIDYHEFGKFFGNDFTSQIIRLMAVESDPAVSLKCRSLYMTGSFRNMKTDWDGEERTAGGLRQVNMAVTAALNMTQVPADLPDLDHPGMTWGNGNWPSLKYLEKILVSRGIYGMEFPERLNWMTPYGLALCYADIKWGEGKLTGGTVPQLTDEVSFVDDYLKSVENGEKMLPFTLYVPNGYGKLADKVIPNVEETTDQNLVFTTSFDNGAESWRELTAADFP